jgi:hypothetical protein
MIRVFSYGGGVQSTAALVLAAQGVIDYHTFLFANVGEDSENPDTLAYIRRYALPFARQHGLTLLELQRVWQTGTRAGQPVTLYGQLVKPESRSIGIPVRLGSGAPGNRSCTVDFKIEVIDRWLREQGARESGAVVGLGISLDEFTRARSGSDLEKPWKTLAYPLLNDIRLPSRSHSGITRQDCITIIKQAGLPVPPKSSCFFCPFHTISTWQEMRQKRPDLFQKACELERLMHERAVRLGRGEIWFTSKHKPLSEVTTDLHQTSWFDEEQEACEPGYCRL